MTPERNEVAAAFRRLAGSGTWARGIDVERRGLVLDMGLSPRGDRLETSVSGSNGETYSQDIRIIRGPGGIVSNLRGTCTCPVGTDCKHVVAACLAAAPHIVGSSGRAIIDPAMAVETGDPVLDAWLRRLETARTAPQTDPDAYPPHVHDRLYYVIVPQAGNGTTELQVWKVRLLKSGALGANPVPYNPNNVQKGHAAQFVHRSDRPICRDLHPSRTHFGSFMYADTLRGETLEAAIATGRTRLGDVHGLHVYTGAPRRCDFAWEEAGAGAQRLAARDGEGKSLMVLASEPVWYVDPESGEAGPLESDLPAALVTALASAPAVPPEAAESVTTILSRGKGTAVPLPTSVKVARLRDVAPVPVLRLFAEAMENSYGYREDSERVFPVLDLSFVYGDADPVPRALREVPAPVPVRADGPGGLALIERDAAVEIETTRTLLSVIADHGFLPATSAAETARALGLRETDLVFEGMEYTNRWRREVAPQAEIDNAAFGVVGDAVPKLAALGWRIEYDESWDWRLYDGPVEFSAGTEKSGIDWFAFSLTVTAGEEELDLLPVILSIIDILPVDANGALPPDFDLTYFLEDLVLYPQLENGARIRLEVGTLAPIVRAFLEVHGLTGFHLAEAGQAARLIEMLEGSGIPWQGDRTLLDLAEKLNALAAHPEAEPPAALTADLRPYQKTGFGWLKALSETGFGGALADDMGLGKTVQALALLAQRHLEDGCERPSLLIAPTSMIGTWQREAARFVPGLKVLVLHGPDRKARFGEIDDHHLIVTTYPLLHRDHETLFARPYELAILDEAQAVKNPASSVSRRIREIEARQRLALTGTPVENNLQELWALFDWLVPGLLGDRRRFVTQLRTPIERDNSPVARQILASRLRPFLLRRTKEEVAADLPPKTVIDEIVPLEGRQAQLYETLRVAMDARVRQAIRRKGVDKSRITILDALLKLRQACCDPALVKLDAARAVTESAKRARLMALLDELMAEGRKVLIFSQFVQMLKLVQADIAARGWDYTMLTGTTRKRPEAIARFQDGEVPIFLISLKAGGTGLTLTEADTVILYDPWWNPAVERQAMDRAHRIGQTKPVFVHRLIAEGTVEAAIQQMQKRKQALADALFEEGAGGKMTLDEDDLTALFAPIG